VAGLDVDLRRFVRIAGPKGPLGTGFRISPTRVLTGHHVVQGKDRFWVLDPDPKDARKWLGSQDSLAEIVWAPEGDARAAEALDAAILATEPVKELSPFTRLLSVGLLATSMWESYGYPKGSSQKPEDRHQLKGETVGFSLDQQRFSVTISDGPESEEGWKGISGAPVFARTPVFARWALVGVLRRTYAGFGEKRSQAIALPALFAHPGFQEALALPDTQSRCSGLLEQATDLLGRHGLAMKVVRHHAPWRAAWDATLEPASLAETICLETPLAEIAEALVDAYCALMDQSDDLIASLVIELLYCALSVAFLSRSAGRLPDRGATEVELDVTLSILVAIANAAIDGRPLALRPAPVPERTYPKSVFDLSEQGPEPGVDPEGLQRTDDLGLTLLKTQAVRPETGPLEAKERSLRYLEQIAAWRGHGSTTLLPANVAGDLSTASPQEQRDALFRLVNKRLAREAKRSGRSYLIARGDSPDERAFLEQLRLRLSELRRVFRKRHSEGLADRLEAEDEIGEPLQRLSLRQAQDRPGRTTEEPQ
jgi:hypothetical protein